MDDQYLDYHASRPFDNFGKINNTIFNYIYIYIHNENNNVFFNNINSYIKRYQI